MNRCVLGIVILVFFLVLGLFVGAAMDSTHLAIAEKLEEASQLVLTEDFSEGTRLAKQAKTDWEDCWKQTASVADHAPMDEIDGLFAQLKSFESPEEAVHYSATCAQLAKLVEAMAEAHRLSLENLL